MVFADYQTPESKPPSTGRATPVTKEAANASWHDERWLEEIEDDFEKPGCWETIPPTWQQRLQHQRAHYGPETIAGVRQFLERVQRKYKKNSKSIT
jgi:hypothetical protein